MEFADDTDAIVDHRPERCSGCGSDLGDAEVTGVEHRQVFDLSRRRLEVTEHRGATCRCDCGTTTKAAFPPAAKGTTCYGPAVRALGCYLVARQHPARGPWPEALGHESSGNGVHHRVAGSREDVGLHAGGDDLRLDN